MAEIDSYVTTIAAHLGANSIRYERPKVKGGGIAPLLWLLDLGVLRSWSGPRTWDLCFGKDRACLEDRGGRTTHPVEPGDRPDPTAMSGRMVMPPVWMAVCAIIMLLVIVQLIFALSMLARIGSSSRR